jgi:hypothetical protein
LTLEERVGITRGVVGWDLADSLSTTDLSTWASPVAWGHWLGEHDVGENTVGHEGGSEERQILDSNHLECQIISAG